MSTNRNTKVSVNDYFQKSNSMPNETINNSKTIDDAKQDVIIQKEKMDPKEFVKSLSKQPLVVAKSRSPIDRDSMASIGFPDASTRSDDSKSDSVIQPNYFSVPGGKMSSSKHKTINDVYTLAVVCNAHKKVALQLNRANFYSLPYVEIIHDQSFAKLFKRLLRQTLVKCNGKATQPVLIDLWRLKQPKVPKRYVKRFLFRTIMYPAKPKDCVCHTKVELDSKVIWLNEEELREFSAPSKLNWDRLKLLGHEPYQVLQTLKSPSLYESVWREVCFEDLITEMNEKLFNHVNFELADVLILYNEFLSTCYPAEQMTFATFVIFCAKLDFQYTFPKFCMLFNSYDLASRGYISFVEFLTGLALMEENLASAQTTLDESLRDLSEQRFKAFFRFYDADLDGRLNYPELLLMINDYVLEILSTTGGSTLPAVFQTSEDKSKFCDDLLMEYGAKDPETERYSLNAIQFKRALEQMLSPASLVNVFIPNLFNVLYRLQFDVLTVAGSKFAFKRPFRNCQYSFCNIEDEDINCPSCKYFNFSLSSHMIRLAKSGQIQDIVSLEPLPRVSFISFAVDIPEQDIYLLANDILIRLQRFATIVFNQALMDSVEANDDSLLNWFFPNQYEMFESIRIIMQTVSNIFLKEKRVVEVRSPCYVFGDLHGNFRDLIGYSQLFWRCSPFLNKGRYLFLGDYVDRGQYGIEVVMYLFCMKILAPANFFILRGNHELREVQEQFSFYNECRNRLSVDLWEVINDTFDVMPVAAVLDDHLYCAHGGIPASVTTLSQMQMIPTPMENPLQQSLEAWEVLWNDPTNAYEMENLPECEQPYIIEGFARNIKRGTAYLYSEFAVNNFLQRNSLDFVLRAHEVFIEGFNFYSRGKVLTVFSTSKYVNLENVAAVLFVKGGKIRVMQIEYDQ